MPELMLQCCQWFDQQRRSSIAVMLVINTFIALQQHFNNIAAISFHNIAWPHGRVATWLKRLNVAATLLDISTGWLSILFSIAAALDKMISKVFALEAQEQACPIKPV